MKHFRRVLIYVKRQYKAVVVSILCALMAAMLFSLSLAAMLPLMKVMIGEEGLHGWVNRSIIKHRSGISFYAIPLKGFITASQTEAGDTRAKLRISNIERDSAAFETKRLRQNDEIIEVRFAGEPAADMDRAQLLDRMARLEGEASVELTVEHENGLQETVIVTFETPWHYRLYADGAYWLLDHVPQGQGPDFKRKAIIRIIMLMLLATIVRCSLRFTQQYLVKRIAFRSLMYLRLDAYKNTIRLPLTHFSTEGVSDTLSRFVQDSNRVLAGITTLLGKAIREPLTMIFLAGAAFAINTEMTLIVIMGAPVAVLVIGKLGRKMRRATKRSLESWSRLLGTLQESLQGIRVVKGYHREQYEQDTFSKIHQRLLKQQFRMGKIDAASGPLIEALSMAAASVGMIFAAYWLTESKMAISEFTTLVMLLAAMAESGRKMGNIYPRLQTANAAAQRIYHLIDTPAEADPANAETLGHLTESLEIRNVSFTYPNSPQPALTNINLTVRAGETIAVVGPNGSGKTTLLGLIPRFFVPDSGSILIDGENIGKVTLASLREQIGIVTQQTVVFNDTIAANIAYGNPEATEDQIIAAARQAYGHEFIENTAEGYQTIIGEQGATLSGGQLQRLAIARAILRNPAILIFDEAMSQIDSDSEAKIQKALLEFAQGRTSFIIAHRLSTIINSDRIVVLDGGRLIAQGKHDELLRSCALYRQLYQMQFAGPTREKTNDLTPAKAAGKSR